MKFSGRSILGSQAGAITEEVFHATNPSTGENLEPVFFSATPEEVNAAAHLANAGWRDDGRASLTTARATNRAMISLLPQSWLLLRQCFCLTNRWR